MAALETHERPCTVCGAASFVVGAEKGVSWFCAEHERQWACSPQYRRFVETPHGEPLRETMLVDFSNAVRLEVFNEVDKGFEVVLGERQAYERAPRWRHNPHIVSF